MHHPVPDRPALGFLGRFTADVTRLITVAVLLTGAATFWPNVALGLLHENFRMFSGAMLANGLCLALCLGVALWLLMPDLLRHSLARVRSGWRRLVFDLVALLFLGFLLMVWTLAATLPSGVLRGLMAAPPEGLALLADGHAGLVLVVSVPVLLVPFYIHTFLFPGRIFARHDRVMVFDGPAERPPAIVSVRETGSGPVGTVFGLIGGALMVLGYLGFAHPLWIPSPEWLGTTLEAERTLHAIGIGVFLMITLATRRVNPERGAARRVVGGLVLAALSAGLGFFASEPLARAGLPWAASYMGETEPMRVEVVVARKGAEHRRKACDRVLMVTLPGHPGHPVTLCGTPPAIWADSAPGDRLVVAGPGTVLGLRPESITRAP